MATQKAIVIQGPGKAALIDNAPVPRLRPDYIKVKTVAVGLNPTDWKHIDWMASPGAIVGCDYSGIVEEVGDKVTLGVKPGDRIAGFNHGSNSVEHEDGSFAEHIVAKGDIQLPLPESLSFEQGASLGVGISTVAQGLFQSLGLPLPSAHPPKHGQPDTVLIYGGSTATGTLAIQLAKLAGATVVTTASPHNFDLLRSLGADYLFDYHNPNVGADIRATTGDRLRLVFDCISIKESAEISGQALSSAGGDYSALLNVTCPRSDVKSRMTLAYSATGEAFYFGGQRYNEAPEDFEFQKKFWPIAGELLAKGLLKPHPLDVRKGLGNVLGGLDELRHNKVSGRKLVYTV